MERGKTNHDGWSELAAMVTIMKTVVVLWENNALVTVVAVGICFVAFFSVIVTTRLTNQQSDYLIKVFIYYT